MEQVTDKNKYKNKIITIPNILSVFRLFLIPIIAVLYLKENYLWSGLVVLLSGFTDLVDGYIARTFNMISDVGKVLDPVADKTNQAVIMLLLAFRFPLMIAPIVLLIIKECFMLITGALIIKKTGITLGAQWHGKAATLILNFTMVLHIFWYNITPEISTAVIAVSTLMILLSFVLYGIRNFSYLTKK